MNTHIGLGRPECPPEIPPEWWAHASWSARLNAVRKMESTLKEEILRGIRVNEELRKEREALRTETATLRRDVEKVRKQYDAIAAKVRRANDGLSSRRDECASLEAERDDLLARMEIAKREIASATSELEQHCVMLTVEAPGNPEESCKARLAELELSNPTKHPTSRKH